MKRIKSYKVFESGSSYDIIEDIKDICLELEDKGFTIQYNTISHEDTSSIVIEKKVNYYGGPRNNYLQRVAYDFVEVEEVANRIKEVLGHRYISSSFRPRRGDGKFIEYDVPGHNFVDDKVIGIRIKYYNI